MSTYYLTLNTSLSINLIIEILLELIKRIFEKKLKRQVRLILPVIVNKNENVDPLKAKKNIHKKEIR